MAKLTTVLSFLTFATVAVYSQECPAEDPVHPVFFPHEEDCNLFYQCSHGQKFVHQCPPDLHFNAELNVCDRPEDAGCMVYSRMMRNQCPPQDPAYPIYFPHETECRLFYQCSHGRKMLQICPKHLHFNPTVNVCDYQDRAGCQKNP